METGAENFAKQYGNNRTEQSNKTYVKLEKDSQETQNFDEPIDLTSSSKSFPENVVNNKEEVKTDINDSNHLVQKPAEGVRYFRPDLHVPYRRHRKRKHTYTLGISSASPNNVFQPYSNSFENRYQNSPSKQEEVLKAAKSLFSKRTRTLYHWMYPNAPKQQIKSAVATSWDSLGNLEKEFYISQVLGRFGFPPCSLMINPQLGGIKELPPLPDTQDFISKTSNELQKAISSISSTVSSAENQVEEEDSQKLMRKSKRKKGRPFGSKNKKWLKNDTGYSISQEFHDDPELRKEFEQFAMNMYDTS